MSVRRLTLALLVAAGLLAAPPHPAMAQTGAKEPVLQPVPEPPPPPPGHELDPALEPQVTILQRGTDTVEEYRIGGKLYMIKVTPARGKPYYLIDHRGDGSFTRHDNFRPETRPPMWVIYSW
jgi:hypothetical protein